MSKVKEVLSRDYSSEWKFETSRSSGAGGQHVNKVETRVTLRWPVTQSTILTEQERTHLQQKWHNQLTQEGELLLHDSSSRSQFRNKEKTIRKLKKALEIAFAPIKQRKPTKPPSSVVRKRLKNKKELGEKKAMRRPPEV